MTYRLRAYCVFALTLLMISHGGYLAAAESKAKTPRVRMITSMGTIELELYPAKAPATVKNFLEYINQGHYNGLIFHRVIKGFMIQGGGFEPNMKQKAAGASIKNEANNGLGNSAGTIAMARTSDPHSASAQFFINTVDNSFLNYTSPTPRGWGYTVFGKVSKGMDVVKKIEGTATGQRGPYGDVPKTNIVIKKIYVIKPKAKGNKETKPKAKAPATQ